VDTEGLNLGTIKIVGIPWYNPADYVRALKIVADREAHPDSYEEWQRAAEEVERQLVGQGMRAVRVNLKLDQFAEWCAKSGIAPDAKARGSWAARAVEAITSAPGQRSKAMTPTSYTPTQCR
jgi:hypothetical protein